MQEKKIWIAWHHSSRSRNIAKYINAELFELFLNNNKIIRHLGSSFWTIRILLKTSPAIIYVQYSFLLLIIIDLYKFIFNKEVKIVADCHTKALRRRIPGVLNFLFWPIKKWSFRFVKLIIIHNHGMIKDAIKLHSNFLVIPDKIPNNSFRKTNENENYCVYSGAFAVDEPVEEVIEAAKLLDGYVKIYWTGKLPKRMKNKAYKNIIFTDYLPFNKYFELIGNASCILALTIEEDCLQSAGYEAIDFEIPLVLSDTYALRQYFQSAAIYTFNDSLKIMSSIKQAIENKEELILEMKKLKIQKNEEFAILIDKLEKEVAN